MGATASKSEKIYKAARNNDAQALQALLRSINQEERSRKLLECTDADGVTALVVACAKGHTRCVTLLLEAGADLHHLTYKPSCSTALHEACAGNHAGVVNLLLERGANPFVENGRGLTPVDVVINNGNVQLLRRLEQQCPFAAYLALKVPRYMGFGAEWKPRWCVIMPRMPNPVMGPAREQQVSRSLLVIYKAADQHVPVAKAWLDGAVARSVTGSKGTSQAQCALALHRSHAAPAGAHLTGDPGVGFTMHLRPVDNRAENVTRFRAFLDICNHRQPGLPQHQRTSSAPAGTGSAPGTPVAPYTPHGPLGQGAPSHLRPGPSSPQQAAAAAKAQALGPVIADTGLTDEELAHRLQQGYDAEVQTYLAENPQDAAMRRLAQQHQGGATGRQQTPPRQSSTPHAGPSPSGTPHYPVIGQGQYAQYGQPDVMPFRPDQGQHMQPQHAQSSSDPAVYQTQEGGLQHNASAPPLPPPRGPPPAQGSDSSQWWNFLPAAPAPPLSASTEGLPPAQDTGAVTYSNQTTGSTQPSRNPSGDEDGMCVVCLSNPCSAGFVHGDSVHKCCCKECALDLKQKQYPTCPMCRQRIEHIILNFF